MVRRIILLAVGALLLFLLLCFSDEALDVFMTKRVEVRTIADKERPRVSKEIRQSPSRVWDWWKRRQGGAS